MFERILTRAFRGRAMKRDPESAVRQSAVEIARASINQRWTTAECAELLACCDSWVRMHVTKGIPRGTVPLGHIRSFMADVKAYQLGGRWEDYRHEHNLDLIADIVLEAFATVEATGREPELVFPAYGRRLLFASGDRFLTKDQVVHLFGCPIRWLEGPRSQLTRFDLAMGRNKGRPFVRFSHLEAVAERDRLHPRGLDASQGYKWISRSSPISFG